MTDPIRDDLWFCSDCMFYHANGDLPEDEELAKAVEAGFQGFTDDGCHVANNDQGEDGESTDKEFSWAACDCCGSRLGGARYQHAIFATDDNQGIPKDFPVQPLKEGQAAKDRVTCGHCNRSWDDGISTSMTPTPAGRCPFEEFHEYPEENAAGDFANTTLDF